MRYIRGQVFVIFVVFFISCSHAQSNAQSGQAPPSLQEQLSAQYTMAKVTAAAGGVAVQETGTALIVQKEGLVAIPAAVLFGCPSKYQDGNLHKPNGFCTAMVGNNSRPVKKGDRLYPLKFKVDTKGGKISLDLLSCDPCVGAESANIYKTQMVLEYPKGALDKVGVPEVEDTIAQVLTIDDSNTNQQGQGQGQDQQQSAPQDNQQAAQEPAPEPQTIQIGQTRDEVDAALGKPETVANVGTKQICKYKDFRVTFVNGKVVDIQ